VPVSNPTGPRALTSTNCARVYATGTDVLCVSLDRISVLYKAEVMDDQFRVRQTLPLGGIPSRARLSPDGSLAATTAFTNVGDSYTTTNFSTRTYVSTVGGNKKSSSLEDFSLIHQGKRISPVDRNFWGVTFADDNRFYATVAFGGHTWLVQGDIARRTVTTLREDAECPSLSPDGRRLVYKKRYGKPAGDWRLASLDLATGTETKLAETRSIDDQVEWLDNDRVLYGVPGSGGDPDLYDVYVVPVDGSGQATVLIPNASSPAVVR
jgi:Tol biopolymer transport system component